MVTNFKSVIWIFILLSFNSCNTKEGRNEVNLQKIKKGMSVIEVETTMGKPGKLVSWKSEPHTFQYMYMAPLGSSDNFYIIFSSDDSLVKSINYGN